MIYSDSGKPFCFWLTLLCLSYVGPLTYGQTSLLDTEVTLQQRDGTIRTVLRELTEKSGVTFSYSEDIVPMDKEVHLSGTEQSLREVLQALFGDTSIDFTVRNNLIILGKRVGRQPGSRTISGYIRDKASAENLIGAYIVESTTGAGTTSNQYGFYSITLPQEANQLRFSYAGYQPTIVTLRSPGDTILQIELENTVLNEVVVTATQAENAQESTQMSAVTAAADQITSTPGLLGETDVAKTLQLLPGVKAGSEGSSGLYVRGGGPDQNLVLLDGVPVYNAFHIFGLYSIFHSEALNRVQLIKGGFPARYGGRLSSVVDISMKEGNQKKVGGEASLGLITSKLTLEGPLVKNRTSFIISGRRTYIDLLTRLILNLSSNGNTSAGYYFYDVNTKINHRLSNRDRLYLSTYLGADKALVRNEQDTTDTPFKSRLGVVWGNVITALRWNHVFNQQLFGNMTFTYSRYHFNVSNTTQETMLVNNVPQSQFSKVVYTSGIRDWSGKIDFDFLPNPNHFVRFGLQATTHAFTPGIAAYKVSTLSDTVVGGQKITAGEFSAYLEDDWKISNKLKVNAGAHFSAFVVDRRLYPSVQPRLSARYFLGEQLSLKASYTHTVQFVHLLSSSSIGLPTDLWIPSTRLVRPQSAHQWAVGLSSQVGSHYELTVEGYYKSMANLIEYREGTSFFLNNTDWQQEITSGTGRSTGVEFFFRKSTGRTTGWIGYTLSYTDRLFKELNFGKRFPYRYDRRHDISTVLTHRWSPKLDGTLAWVYGTGNAVSLPVATYPVAPYPGSMAPPEEINVYNGRNGFRMRAYHRLDAAINFRKQKKRWERTWTVSIYNLYNRRNPFYIDSRRKNGERKFGQVSLFPIIPSFSYSIKF